MEWDNLQDLGKVRWIKYDVESNEINIAYIIIINNNYWKLR